MIHCIVGAIMACTSQAAMYIDGPLDPGRRAVPVSYAYNYALYTVPLQRPPFPFAFGITGRRA